ncbi:MAG: transaldolase [Anaerolineae bacterium]|nr:transaldolase [Anaerolineae bacterium]
MKFFLDSAHVDQIEYALDMWHIDGVTTNPKHVQVSGKPFMTVIREIAAIFKGTDKPVSVEVNPHFDKWEDMVAQARVLAAISPNFVIKLPATQAGFKSIAELKKDGIRANLTLVFSASQALQAMRMGAHFVSPFLGWKESNGEETFGMLRDIVAIRDNFGFETQVLASAMRNARQIIDAAALGADICTAGFAVYEDAFDHPYTHVGLGKFQSFWDKTPFE